MHQPRKYCGAEETGSGSVTFRQMVSYHEKNERGSEDSGHQRYMIDMKMYRKLHKREEHNVYSEGTDDLGPEALKQDDPPDQKFIYLMPLTIKSYNLRGRNGWT
jgi:hypothetical protein